MSPGARAIDGDGREDRAAAVAGMLAEAGVVELALLDPRGGWRPLRARETDLPGLLARCAAAGETVELVALDRPLRVEFSPDAVHWVEGEAEGGHQSRPE